MSQTKYVAGCCGIEAESTGEMRKLNFDEPCNEATGEHDWSDDDPMSRALARISCGTFEAGIVDKADNAEWQWFEVHIGDHDEVGASEAITDDAQSEGFSFVGLGESAEGATLRFNRKKPAAEAEEEAARAEIAAEGRLDDRRERHFDREGHF